MAAGKEIRGKIKSVENTKKITKAMEMVAASKCARRRTGCWLPVHTAKNPQHCSPSWRSQP